MAGPRHNFFLKSAIWRINEHTLNQHRIDAFLQGKILASEGVFRDLPQICVRRNLQNTYSYGWSILKFSGYRGGNNYYYSFNYNFKKAIIRAVIAYTTNIACLN